MAADDDVDDYMTMTFDDDAGGGGRGGSGRKKPETSLQRRARLQREGRERGRVLSKAELARAAELEREAALSRSLLEPAKVLSAAAPVNKGLAMMARMGFKPGQALGKKAGSEEAGGSGQKEKQNQQDQKNQQEKQQQQQQQQQKPSPRTAMMEPIRIRVKRDRAGIGARREEDEEESDDGADDKSGVPKTKRSKTAATAAAEVDPLAYRDRIRQERETQRLERLVHAAQVVAEGMDEEAGEETGETTAVMGGRRTQRERPLAEIKVLWRGLIRDRRRAELERAERQLHRKRLDRSLRGGGGGIGGIGGIGEDDDEDEDEDDRLAAGKTAAPLSFLGGGGLRRTVVREAADGDEEEEEENDDEDDEDEDADLVAFDALPPEERLQRIVDWLRMHRRYCFWCKHTYPDALMDGCPGTTEADHD